MEPNSNPIITLTVDMSIHREGFVCRGFLIDFLFILFCIQDLGTKDVCFFVQRRCDAALHRRFKSIEKPQCNDLICWLELARNVLPNVLCTLCAAVRIFGARQQSRKERTYISFYRWYEENFEMSSQAYPHFQGGNVYTYTNIIMWETKNSN